MNLVDWVEIREQIAAVEHNVWMTWAKTILEKESITIERQQRWGKFFIPYAELPEKEKDKDRKQADKVLAVVRKYVTIQ